MRANHATIYKTVNFCQKHLLRELESLNPRGGEWGGIREKVSSRGG